MANAKPTITDQASSFHPQYMRIEEELDRQMADGTLVPGERLPDERLLAEKYQVSRGTIRQALARLEQSYKIQRQQGRGTFVSPITEKAGYLCIIAVGQTARDTLHVTTTIAQVEGLSRQYGLKVAIRYAPTPDDLRQIASEINSDRTIAAALILGTLPPCDLSRWTRSNRVSWAMIAEVASSHRDMPAINQIVTDWYDLHQKMTLHAIDHGAKRPSLWVLGKQWVWSSESISAFQTACASKNLPPQNLSVMDLHTYRTASSHSTDEYHRALSRIMLEQIDQWSKSQTWPDRMIAPGTSIQIWLECLRARPKATKHLIQVPMTAWTLTEHHQQIAPPITPIHITWAHISIANQVKQALVRLLDASTTSRLPMRDYVRDCELVECQPTQLE